MGYFEQELAIVICNLYGDIGSFQTTVIGLENAAIGPRQSPTSLTRKRTGIPSRAPSSSRLT